MESTALLGFILHKIYQGSKSHPVDLGFCYEGETRNTRGDLFTDQL